MQHSTAENVTSEATRKLHDYISKVKVMPEVRQGYMKFEEIIAYERKNAARDAVKDTKIQDIFELLEELGEIPGSLKTKLGEISDTGLLNKYLKFAAKADSIEEFMEHMDDIDAENKCSG